MVPPLELLATLQHMFRKKKETQKKSTIPTCPTAPPMVQQLGGGESWEYTGGGGHKTIKAKRILTKK